MKLAILAGFLIGMGAIVNLSVGGIYGALFFAFGLMTIVSFKYNLFTGKADLLATKEITVWELSKIWIGNFIGTFGCAFLIGITPIGCNIIDKANQIVLLRSSQSFITNVVLGIFCGLSMYIAVSGFKLTNNYLFTFIPVALFILCGFNHCVADMFYSALGATHWTHFLHLIPTTFGNILGCCFIPFITYKLN